MSGRRIVINSTKKIVGGFFKLVKQFSSTPTLRTIIPGKLQTPVFFLGTEIGQYSMNLMFSTETG